LVLSVSGPEFIFKKGNAHLEETMFRRLLMIFMAGRIFGMLGRRGNHGWSYRRSSQGWGTRHNPWQGRNLTHLFGRRRRSFI
jgi:hypothetical protein